MVRLTRTPWWCGAILIWWYFFQVTRSFVSLSPQKDGLNILYVWILIATGLVGLPFVFLLRNLKIARFFDRPFPQASLRTSRFLYIGIFCVTVTILKNIDVSWLNYKDLGLTVVVYTICRFILILYLFVLCLVLGSLVLKKTLDCLSHVISCFFLGASIYGLVITGVGLVGLLNLWTVLFITLPLLYLAPSIIHPMARTLTQTLKDALGKWDSLELGVHFLLGWFLVIGGGFLLFSNGLYPGPILNDEWEHYLHYYRAVLQHGSLVPNEVWYHFYLSKGAGLFFLSGVLSDFLSAQLVSFCFAVMIGVIVFDLLKSLCRDTVWALGGVIIFFTLYDGGFFRHHVVLTGYIAFFIWISIRLLENPQRYSQIFWAALPLSSFYVGFYLPPAASLTALFFGFMALGVALRSKTRAYFVHFLTLVLSTVLGVVVALGINYAFTGLAEMVPMKTFWAMADQAKFGRVFGTYCAKFFLFEQLRFDRILHSAMLHPDIWYEWFSAVFRINFFQFIHFPTLLLLSAVFFVSKIFTKTRLQDIRHQGHGMFVLSMFLLVALLMSQLALMASTFRIFTFITFFLTVIGIVLANMTSEAFMIPAFKRIFSAAFCVILCLSAMAQTATRTDTTRLKTIGAYLVGRQSFAGVMAEADRHFSSSVNLQFFTKLREMIGPTERVLCLSYFPSPGYSFPGIGVVSEPSYTLGIHQQKIVEGTPEQAKAYLQALHINYFIITRRSVYLPSTSILSNLFKAKNLNKMFKAILTDNDNFVLTWREPNDVEPLSPLLTQTMELRQEKPLYYPFSDDFARLSDDFNKRLSEIVDQMPLDGHQEKLSADLTASITEVLRQKMLPKITLDGNKTLLNDLIAAIEKKMEPEVSRLLQQTKQIAQNQAGSDEASGRVQRQLIKAHLADFIRPPMLQAYTEKANQDTTEALKFSLTHVAYQILNKVD